MNPERRMNEVASWPLVGVTARAEAVASPAGFPRVLVKRAYPETLASFGAIPLIIPASLEPHQLRAAYERVGGLLLPGGLDVDPARYSAARHPALGETDQALDDVELTLACWALDDGKPVLGLCRGQQVLNVATGGSLYQDLATERPSGLEHAQRGDDRYRPSHELRLDPDSRLAALLGRTTLLVNSVHHQAVRALGCGWRACGWAADGVVEAIERTAADGGFAFGLQCHPEESWREEPAFAELFRAFVAAASQLPCGRD
jgi:putative glutamine amidotransferase